MRTSFITMIVLLFGTAALAGTPQTFGERADSNNAFYSGEKMNYIVKSPVHFKMITDEARTDGYSFAFVPDTSDYHSSPVIIGVNIYKIRQLPFSTVLMNDTNSIREHYGPDLIIRPIDSVTNESGQTMTAFYLDNKKQFIPNVMTAYFYGDTEVLIFELSIAPGVLRPKAEEWFMQCLKGFSALKQATLGVK
jgi:hypothetical protein